MISGPAAWIFIFFALPLNGKVRFEQGSGGRKQRWIQFS